MGIGASPSWTRERNAITKSVFGWLAPNVAARRNPGKMPIVNPFQKMGLESPDRETPTATFDELQTFRAKAVELGLSSLATAALIGWEWLQREVDIFATFEVTHYRPKERPNTVRVIHEKTNEENWIPLPDEKTGAPFYPELMAELDAIKRTRALMRSSD
jgi:hypothetical protein